MHLGYSEEQCGTFPVGPASERILSTKPWTSLMLVERSAGPKNDRSCTHFRELKRWSEELPVDMRWTDPWTSRLPTFGSCRMKHEIPWWNQIRQHSAFSWKEMANAFNNGLGRTGNSLGCCWDGFLGKFPNDVFSIWNMVNPWSLTHPTFRPSHVSSVFNTLGW